MPSARALRRLAAGAALLALPLALAACRREAPLDERVGQRLEAKDYDGALAILDRRLTREPGDDAVKALKVRVLLTAGRVEQAIAGYAALPEALIETNAPLARQLVVSLVRDALRRDDAYLQSRGALALAALGDAEALPLFREALAHPNPAVRATVVRGLGLLKNHEAAALAQSALTDDDGGVRAVAAEALGMMRAERARPQLREALKDPEGGVRLRAVVALALLGDPQAQAILRRAILAWEAWQPAGETCATPRLRPAVDKVLVMNNPNEGDYVQIVVAEAVARLGDPKGRATLVRMLRHPCRFLALFAAESLSNLGDQAPRTFLRTVVEDPADRGDRMYAAWTLARLGDGAGGPAVAELLTHQDEHIRQRAAWTLGQMGRLAPVSPLRKALTDPDMAVRYQAAWALGEVVLAGRQPPRPQEG